LPMPTRRIGFGFRHDRRREWPLSASGPIPALHSDTVASGTGSSNPARSSRESGFSGNRFFRCGSSSRGAG
jgi:hypothetical protein